MLRHLQARPRVALPAALAVLGGIAALAWYLSATFAGAQSEAERRSSILAELAAVYLQEGTTLDTVVVADATNPAEREVVAEVAHGAGWRVNGSVSPDGRMLAMAVNPRGSRMAEAQAVLRVLDLETARDTVLAEGFDALGRIVWSEDGSRIVLRRTNLDANLIALVAVDASSGQAVVLVEKRAAGLYPLSLDANGSLLYVQLDETGSAVYRDGRLLAVLSETFTRDWRLSPDGGSVAFIETEPGSSPGARIVSLASREVVSAGAANPAIGVAWRPGSDVPDFGGGSSEATRDGAPYFEAPIAWSADGEVLALTEYAGAPLGVTGSEVQLRQPDGSDLPLGEGKVTFLGWAP